MTPRVYPLSQVAAVALALIGFSLTCTAFFPGFMSVDSLTQYGASKNLVLDDWQPPIMSGLWSVLNMVFSGPEGLLFFHQTLLWLGLYLWYRHFSERCCSWMLLLVGFLPWVANFSGVLWKDVGMAFALLLVSGIAAGKRSLARGTLALLLLFYAVNLRQNAILAALPITVYWLYRWAPGMPHWRRALLVAMTLGLALIGGAVLNYKILKAERTHPSSYMMIDDLAFVSLYTRTSLIPGVTLDEIQDCAGRRLGQTNLVGKSFCLGEKMAPRGGAVPAETLEHAWREAVTKNLSDYAAFRVAAFGYLLRSPLAAPYYIWQPGIAPNSLGVSAQRTPFASYVESAVAAAAQQAPYLFKPYWWLWLGLVLLLYTPVMSHSPARSAVRALALSSVSYIAGYLPVTPMADFRYVYWSVLASTLAVALSILYPTRPTVGSARRWAVAGAMVAVVLGGGLCLQRAPLVTIEEVLLPQLQPYAIPIPVQPVYSGARRSNGTYLAVGADPQLVFDVRGQDLNGSAVRFLSFEIRCEPSTNHSEVQLFWWGGTESGPTEARSIAFAARNGVNLVSTDGLPGWSGLGSISALRVDISNPSECPAFTMENLIAYRGSTSRQL